MRVLICRIMKGTMKKTIYVIDDDDDVRDVISFVLNEENYEVEGFSDPTLALKQLKSCDPANYPGLIFVDYHMPKMTGPEFIFTLKEFHPDTFGKIPMILCTARGETREEHKIPAEVKILLKPMDLEELTAMARSSYKNL